MVRVKDEMRMNIESYEKLYQSALSYGIRKSLIFTNEKNNLRNNIKDYEDMILELENEVSYLEEEIETIKNNNEA